MAARCLEAADRQNILPLAEVQLLEAGGTQPLLERSLRLAAADSTPIGIDLKQAYSPRVPLKDFAKLTASFQAKGLLVWPIVRASDALIDLPNLPHFKDQPGFILRVHPNETLCARGLMAFQGPCQRCTPGELASNYVSPRLLLKANTGTGGIQNLN